MKADTLITLYNAKIKHIKNITPEIILDVLNELIKPVEYLSYDNKLKIIDQTIKDSENAKYPTAERSRNFIINMILAYTNIECDYKGFDILSENQMLDIIISTFESEFKLCSNLLQMCIKDIESG